MAQPPQPELGTNTSPEELGQLANTRPDLHRDIAGHYGAPPQLLHWLAAHSTDPHAREIAAQRLAAIGGGPGSIPVAPAPSVAPKKSKKGRALLVAISAILVLCLVGVGISVLHNRSDNHANDSDLPVDTEVVGWNTLNLSFAHEPEMLDQCEKEQGIDQLGINHADEHGPYLAMRACAHDIYEVQGTAITPISTPAEIEDGNSSLKHLDNGIAYYDAGEQGILLWDLKSGNIDKFENPLDGVIHRFLVISKDHYIIFTAEDWESGDVTVSAIKDGQVIWSENGLESACGDDFLQISEDRTWLYCPADDDGRPGAVVFTETGQVIPAPEGATWRILLRDGVLYFTGDPLDHTVAHEAQAFDTMGKRIDGVPGIPADSYISLYITPSVTQWTANVNAVTERIADTSEAQLAWILSAHEPLFASPVGQSDPDDPSTAQGMVFGNVVVQCDPKYSWVVDHGNKLLCYSAESIEVYDISGDAISGNQSLWELRDVVNGGLQDGANFDNNKLIIQFGGDLYLFRN